jgi:hypothetical protein
VNADYFMESAGEGMFLFARMAPYLEEFRRDISPVAFQNAEWVAKNTPVGQRMFAMFTARVEKLLASK